MPRVLLAIDGDLCGPMSIGTVAVVRALEKHLALPLPEASEIVERCVFDGEQVALPAPSLTAANALLGAFRELPAAPRIHASIID